MVDPDGAEDLRESAWLYVQSCLSRNGVISRAEIMDFTYRGVRLALADRGRGIRQPRGMTATLSILTSFSARPGEEPYADEMGADGYPRYKWQRDPDSRDNAGLRVAIRTGVPLIWFHGVAQGLFTAERVWLIDEEPDSQQVVVALDEQMHLNWTRLAHPEPEFAEDIRNYALRLVKQRLDQRVFSQRVLIAYRHSCGVCALNQTPLLEAAHIRPWAEGGRAVIPNGIALCTLHHAAYDSRIIGIHPNLRIEVRRDVLEQHDGPTLTHALQALHGARLTVPRSPASHPDAGALEDRYAQFLRAG